MKRIIFQIIVAATLFTPCHGYATVYQLPVQPEPANISSYWCYAAGILAILNRYNIYPGVTTETGSSDKGQCLIANKVYNNKKMKYDCCVIDDPDQCFSATSTDVYNIFNSDYGLSVSQESSLTWSSLVDKVGTNKIPIMAVRESKNSDWEHTWIIVGLDTTTTRVKVMDTSIGEYIEMSYASLVEDTNYVWRRSYIPYDAPPADVTLRYVLLQSSWNFQASGNITAGPDIILLASNPDDPPIITKFIVGTTKRISLKKGFEVKKGAQFEAKRQ